VAASFGAIGFGSDTCGSIRIPSAFNNLVGLRPSKGLSSIFGIMPLSHSQDTGGPLARTVEDLAIVLDLTVGFDANDPATQKMRSMEPPEFVENLHSVDVNNLRFGKINTFFDEASNETQEVTGRAVDWFESQGVEIIEVGIPNLPELVAASRLIAFEFVKTLINI
jgi:Asp-tRNA(Asn)/Glu-tRNA(Gln) amidotransferase A subunit family amidase